MEHMKPETLQFLRDAREDLARQLAALDSALGILGGAGFAAPPALPALQIVEHRIKAPRTKTTKLPPPSPKGGKMAARRALYIAAIEKCGETFSAEELIERGKLEADAKVVSGNLNWWTKKGILAKGDKGSSALAGTWRRGLGWRKFSGSAEMAPAPAVVRKARKSAPARARAVAPLVPESSEKPKPPAMAGIGPGMRLSRTAGTRQSPQATALESLFAGLSGSYPAVAIIEMVRKSWPDLVSTAAKETDLRVRLIDMSTAGKIRRIGVGAGAHYSAVPGRQPAAAASDDLRISVPRDADVGGGE
jgi:hypothetical protein